MAARDGSPWNTSFSIGLGMTTGGMRPFTAPENPLVFRSRKDQLGSASGFAAHIFVEKIHWKPSDDDGARPDFGFRAGIATNSYTQEFEKEVFDGYKFNYTRFPIEFLICLSSKDAYIRDEDEVRVTNDRIVFHKGTGVIKTNMTVFFHGGLSYGTLNTVIAENKSLFTEKYTDSFNLIRSNISKNDPALLAGLEFRTGYIGFDVYYQKSLATIYKGADVRNRIWGFMFKLIW